MPGGWAPPGKDAPSHRWRYDMAKGFVPPGHGTKKEGTQYVLDESFDPQNAPKGFHLMASPPGTTAPIDHVNYTPDTNEVHDRGQLAPVDKMNYSFVPTGPISQGWRPRTSTPPVGSGADGGGTAYPGTPPLPTMGAGGPVQSQGHTQSADMGGYGTNSPGTGFWFRGFGAGADENGYTPDDPNYDPYTEQNPDDPYGDPSTPQTPAAAAPAAQAPAADVGGPAQGPPDPAGVPPNFSGRRGDIEYRNGKQVGYWVKETNPANPAGDPIDKFIPSPEKPPAAPTAATEHWTRGQPRSDGSVIETNDTTGASRVIPGPRAPATTDQYPKQQFVGGQWWQIDAKGGQPHAITDPNAGKPATETAANQVWTDTEFRSDGSIVQTNPHGEKRVVPGPKQQPQFHVIGNRIIRSDPNDPNGSGTVVYTAPATLQLQTLNDGTIVGIHPETGQTQTIYQDPSKRDQTAATLEQTQATTGQTRASTRSTEENTRATMMGQVPQVSYAGGNIITPYGAESTLEDYNPLTHQTSSRHYGNRMTVPDLQRAYGIQPAQDTSPTPAPAADPTPSIRTPAPEPVAPAAAPPTDVGSVMAPPGDAGTAADPMHAPGGDSPYPQTPFEQSGISEGSSRRPPLDMPVDDTGAGADDLQKNLRKSIPNWRGGPNKAKRWRGLGKKFYGPGLEDFTPYVGVGADIVPPSATGQPWKPPVDPQQVVGTGHKFGDRLKGGEPVHKGTDLQAYKGTPVKAPVDGTIKVENNPKGLGISVSVVDAKGVAHKLSHLDKVLVKNGAQVKQGQPVGTVGETGNTTGPHLDIREQKPNGQMLNPERHMPDLTAMPPAPGTEMMTGSGADDDFTTGWNDGQTSNLRTQQRDRTEGLVPGVRNDPQYDVTNPFQDTRPLASGDWGGALPGSSVWDSVPWPNTSDQGNEGWMMARRNPMNSDIVNDTGGQTDQGGDWTPRSGGWTPPNQGEIAAPKPRIMLPMPGGPGMTDVGADWAPGAAGGVTASNMPGRSWKPGNDPQGFDPSQFQQIGRYPSRGTEGGYRNPNDPFRVEGDTEPGAAISSPRSDIVTLPEENFERIPTRYDPARAQTGVNESTSIFDDRPGGNPAHDEMMRWRDKEGTLGTGADMPGMPPSMGGGGPPGASSGPPVPQMPPGGGITPPSPGGGPSDPKVMMLIQALMQLLGGGGGAAGGMPSPQMGGGGATPPPAPPMPGAGADIKGLGAAGTGWSPRGGAASSGWAPRAPLAMRNGALGSGADTRVGAGGMRLANGNWSDALADTPQNQKQYGQGSGYQGGYGYKGATQAAPAPGNPTGGPGGGTNVAISPADRARLDLDTQVAQWNHDQQTATLTQQAQQETDRHNEMVQQLQQQAQQNADYKSIQDALNQENIRHNQQQEQLTQQQQALDKTLETMREQSQAALQQGQQGWQTGERQGTEAWQTSERLGTQQFQSGQQSKTDAMSVMQSALNAPWLQGLLKLGVNPGSQAGAAIPGAQNPWQNLMNVIFGGNQGNNPFATAGPQPQAQQPTQGAAPTGANPGNQGLSAGATTQPGPGADPTQAANNRMLFNPQQSGSQPTGTTPPQANPGVDQSGGPAAPMSGPALPSAQEWAQMTVPQKAALQSSVMAEGPGAWQNFQNQFQTANGNQAPDQTALQSAIATPEDNLGTMMSADMFGEGAPTYQQRQQQTWNKAKAPNVQQTMLSGTGYGQDNKDHGWIKRKPKSKKKRGWRKPAYAKS